MLLILTAAGWVLLLVTLFIVLRDFMKYVLRRTFSSVKAQSFVDFGEYATTFFSVALLTITGFILYKFLMALLAYLVSGDLISFFRMMRGVYSIGHELQNPFAWQHMLTGLFGKTLVQLISIFFIYRGIRFFMYRMNQRFETETYSEGDVLCYGFFSVLMFIGLEILSYIQNIPQLSRTIHIFYLVIANTALICYFLSLSHLHQMLRVRYRRSLPRYVTFSRTTKNIVVSPSATILATWIIGIVLNFPLYLGTQFLENNAAVLLFGLLSLTLFTWVARKLLAKGFNYFGAIMFFDSQEPVTELTGHRNKIPGVAYAWVLGGIGIVLLLFSTGSFGVLIFLAVSVLFILILSHVLVYLTGLVVSILLAVTIRFKRPQIDQHTMINYLKVTGNGLVLSLFPGLLLILGMFTLISLFPKQYRITPHTNYINTVVDGHGHPLFYGSFNGNACAPVASDNIPLPIIKFIQLQEDRDFERQNSFWPKWSNWHGISLASLYRMISGAGGGSNINMQLIKNEAFSGTFPRDFQRKYTELLAAYQLSLQLSPREIMTHYVNQVGMNGGIGHQGVLMAARQAFGRSLSELNELEQLYLVSTLKRGTLFKTENRYVSYREVPYHREEIKQALLSQVEIWQSAGLISEEEAHVLKSQQLRFHDEQTDKLLSVSTKEFLKRQMSGPGANGKTFTAFVTRENQEQVQSAVDKFEHHFRSVLDKNGHRLYSAALVIDVESGRIMGHHGGHGLSDLTTLSGGSPTGSLIKPFILLELMEGLENPSSLKLYDGKVKGRFTPNNYSRRYSNQMKGINEIISKSLNAPMVNVRLLRDPIELFSAVEQRFERQGIAPDQFLDLGNPGKKGEYEVNYPLGSRNMTLYDIAQLYQTLLNDGLYKELKAYDQVYDPISMRSIKIPQKSAQIYDPVITEILKDAMHHTMLRGGTGTHMLHLLPGDQKLYAKTGTSDKAIHGYTVLSDGRLLIVSYVTYGKVVGDHLELNATPPIPYGSGVRSAGILAALMFQEFKNTAPNNYSLKLISEAH